MERPPGGAHWGGLHGAAEPPGHCEAGGESEAGEGAELDADSAGGWEAESDEAGERTRDLFTSAEHPSPSAALAAAAALGFDLRALQQAGGLDFYATVKVVNWLRSSVAARRWGDVPPAEQAAQAAAAVAADRQLWDQERYLAPVIEGDPLLWVLMGSAEDEEDDDDDGDGGRGDGAAPRQAAAGPASDSAELQRLRAENAALREQIRALVSDDAPAAGSPAAVRQPPRPACQLQGYAAERQRATDYVATWYRTALADNSALISGKVVLDAGCGAGARSVAAARAGARRVIAQDPEGWLASAAADAGAANGFPGVIEPFDPEQLAPASVDVLVSDWMGSALLLGSTLPSLISLRSRYLRPGGMVLPDRATAYCAAVSSKALVQCGDGLCLPALAELAAGAAVAAPVVPSHLVTSVGELFTVNVDIASAADLHLDKEVLLTAVAAEAVECGALAVWWDCQIAAPGASCSTALSTAPGSPDSRWQQTVFALPASVWLQKGAAPVGTASGAGGKSSVSGEVGSRELPAAALRVWLRTVDSQQGGLALQVEAAPESGGRCGRRQGGSYYT
eukprot:TRINITY_DN25964_c0_g1_i1.p1 TRINITY_DN25964_c0_g1~~TRINITY_DN25964_c0_g1_i1.p1  ORF type:complete len:594 (+),score=167.78 TRINITY_DN25964_c0_g1_i1:85-1782(+)